MSKNKKITVLTELNNQRLDLFLSEKLGVSRSQAQKLIEQEQILINGEAPKKMGEKVRVGDQITVTPQSSPASAGSRSRRDNLQILQSASAQTAKTQRLKDYKISDVKIVATTPDYLVVEKPTGMLTHPTMANETNTLVNFLVKKYPEIKGVGDLAPRPRSGLDVRPGIVHRLDKEASGLLVVALTQKMFNHLKDQFKNRIIEKEYWALAHGKVAKDWGVLTFPIARGKTYERMAARPIIKQPDRVQNIEPLQSNGVGAKNVLPSTDNDTTPEEQFYASAIGGSASGGKEAKTEFIVEKRFVNFTLLRVILHTGRMHQIRVHLLAYNHPLVGDPLYFQKKRKRMWDEKLGRLFLHSTKLAFTDLEGQKQTFESPLPEELEKFLKLLK